ncbi:signal peptidase I [Pseudoteredinibacter isoporae]|uniref:Signal peptidase I n=1 Tax=Pseudoteredinibacter isoporae TaxID=570281 RepID=A0A7X0MVI3_9GAMM|nr:signal peptidase I [Pseudoteredinibacter isoporae]MBB6519874.1 signal peptidase I [Pseudoteredinibacter isoporae]NHO85452.1 signal peptidase I [Pseudoteredinibacter isoporae]NIB26096.1 signal peptidase I [Pseudoteredinibacter isoporae]
MKHFFQENRSFFLFIAGMMMFRSAIADWNDVPTGSMLPTITEGDRITVNKMAYGLRLPFTGTVISAAEMAKRGDIVVFDSVAADKRLVKRVIGVPGDTVSMHRHRLTINGLPLDYENLQDDIYVEKLEGRPHKVRIENVHGPLANFSAVTVPEGHYLVLGDNRNNSADSRVYGFIPQKELRGRAGSVAVSFDYENYFLPRQERFALKLD